MRKVLLLSIILVLALVTFPEKSYAESSNRDVKGVIFVSEYQPKTIINEGYWMPARMALAPGVDAIYWDNENKIAKFVSEGKALVFNFSGKPYIEGEYDYQLPNNVAKFENGVIYIDSIWFGKVFRYDEYSFEDRSELDIWREKLSFLHLNIEFIWQKDNYNYINIIYDKDKK